MEKYRKPDQYYADQYDRHTIQILKKLERELFCQPSDKLRYMRYIKYHDALAVRSQDRDESIRSSKSKDEHYDYLVSRTPVPEKIRCNTCGLRMFLETHFFGKQNIPILFVFKCPKGHTPKKVVYPEGDEYVIPKQKCRHCGGELTSVMRKEKKVFIFTETCNGCGAVTIDEYQDIEEESITEEDRKKYCVPKMNTFIQEIEALANFAKQFKELESENIEEEYNFGNIEKITIPKLEIRLAEIAQKVGFVKFQFNAPGVGKHIIVPFSVQDPSDRSEADSIKKFSKALKKEVFETNWRLMSEGISYRLGLLSGRLRACEDHEGLKKISEEIKKKKPKES